MQNVTVQATAHGCTVNLRSERKRLHSGRLVGRSLQPIVRIFHFSCSMLVGGMGAACSLLHEPLVSSGTIRAANVAITAIIAGLSQKGSSRGIPCFGSLYSIIFL